MYKCVLKKLHLWGIYKKITMYRVNVLLAGTKEKNFEKKRKLLNRLDGFSIGEGTKIVGPIVSYGTLTVGKNCWIGTNLRIHGNGSVIIGDCCDLCPEVAFFTGGHQIGDASRRAGAGITHHQTVGNGVWIGGRSYIVNDTAIGDGCVIAAGACVVKDVPANTLVGGVPARKLRDLNDEHT